MKTLIYLFAIVMLLFAGCANDEMFDETRGKNMSKLIRLRPMIFFIIILSFSNFTKLAASDWIKIWGPTEFVIVDGETGTVYAKPALGTSITQGIYRWEGIPNVWTPLGMQAKKCVVSGWKPNNALYCLTEEGIVYKFKGAQNSWESLGGPSIGKASDIFGGPDQLLAVGTGAIKDIYRWDEISKSWIKIGGPGKSFIVGRSSDPEFKIQVYGQSPDDAASDINGIYQWSGAWQKRGGPAGSIYISQSTLFATNPQSGDMMSLTPTGWKRVGGSGNMFATDHKGHLFGLSPDKSAVYRWTGTPNNWEKIGGSADKIFAGWDRMLFATNPDSKDLMFYRPSCPQFANIPNFTGTIITEKMKPVSGNKNVLTILWDPHRPDHPAPPKEEIEKMLFGTTTSAKEWFIQNSGGKLNIVNAGILGWYDAPPEKQGEHYWDNDNHQVKFNDGWKSGHVEKWADAVKRAANDFNFSTYDINKDGKITRDELAILIVIPQKESFGTAMQLSVGQQLPVILPLKVQGNTEIAQIVELYSGIPVDIGAAVHELAHQILGTPDMYFLGGWPFAAGAYSNSDASSVGAVNISGPEKLKLGWLNYKVATQNGNYSLNAIETSNDALILYNPKRGSDEYFLIENRWRGNSYDDGDSHGYLGLQADGIAIWHIIENPEVFNNVNPFPPTGVKGEWGRLGIRLIRANGGFPWDEKKALFINKGVTVSDLTFPAKLIWLDGSRSGFEVKMLSDPGTEVQLGLTISCLEN